MAINPRLWAIIQQYAPRYGLDPRAVAAIAMNESGGHFNAVGDGGTSYGPWQLHVGGALPRGETAAWAESLPGVIYALRTMAASGARGLTGQAAVSAISRDFERPADPAAEIATALRYYQSPGFARGSAAAGMGGGGSVGGGGAAAIAALMQRPISVAAAPAQPTALASLQNLLATRAATEPAVAATPFGQSTAPTSGTFATALDSLHSKLLGGVG